MSDLIQPAKADPVVGRLAGNSQIVLIGLLVLLCLAISIGAPQFYPSKTSLPSCGSARWC